MELIYRTITSIMKRHFHPLYDKWTSCENAALVASKVRKLVPTAGNAKATVQWVNSMRKHFFLWHNHKNMLKPLQMKQVCMEWCRVPIFDQWKERSDSRMHGAHVGGEAQIKRGVHSNQAVQKGLLLLWWKWILDFVLWIEWIERHSAANLMILSTRADKILQNNT